MPIINIQILEGRSEEKIEELLVNVTTVVAETLNAPKESVRVLVTEVNKTHWSIGGISAKKLKK